MTLRLLNPVTTVYKRGAVGSIVNGEYVPGALTTTAIVISIQPLTDEEMLSLPEGRRTMRHVKAYTATRLQAVDQVNGTPADLVAFDGFDFEVQKVEDWFIGTHLAHYKVIMAKVNP